MRQYCSCASSIKFIILLALCIEFPYLEAIFISSCKTPVIKFGRVRSRQRGRAIKFLCNPGFQLAGDRTAFCVNRSWDVPIPKCVRGPCLKKITNPLHGVTLPSHNGAVANFYCQQGYELNGPSAAYCDGFTWDIHMPSCIPTNSTPHLFCDFENANLCYWSHDISHDMEWVRDSYKTPTGYSMPTGPSFDHTLGKGFGGHYMYIESSSRRVNDTARLISPIFTKISNPCLEFYYHMYGRTTGTLRAYVRKISDSWPPNSSAIVFSKNGDQGDKWYRAFIDLKEISMNEFQIVLEGIRGNGYVSDIAVDDIRIIPNCNFTTELNVQLTTTEDEIISSTSEILMTIDTCENRCGSLNNNLTLSLNESSLNIINCDCDESCFETSRCCPDYVDFCIIPTTPILASSSSLAPLPEETNTVSSNNKDSNEIMINKNAAIITTSRGTTTTKKLNLIIIEQAPTTPKIVKKEFSTERIIITSTSIPSSVEPADEDFDNLTEDYDEKLLNSDKDYPAEPEPVQQIDINKKTIIKKLNYSSSSTESTNTLSTNLKLAAIILSVILLTGLIGIVSIRKLLRRINKRRMNSNNQGNSQSDVRFLTADEILDFSLDSS